MEKIYSVKNLDCAHCAGKIEEAINKLDGVESAVLIFASRKLKLNGDVGLSELNSIASKIEAGVEIVPESEGEEERVNLKGEIAVLIVGVAVFACALLAGSFIESTVIRVLLFAAAYLILGHKILLSTVKNVAAGIIFDENFLMTIATLGAFVLGEYSEAVGVVLFFKIGEIFENYAVNKSRKAITAAAGLKVEEVDLLMDGEFVRCGSENITVGSIIRVKAGERIAADGVIEEGETRLDTSAVNGEPVPVSVSAGDVVMSGCINLSGVITVRATAAASESTVSKIAEAVENAVASKPKIDRFITRFAKIYTPIVIAAAVLTAVIPSLITGEWGKWVYTALTFLVISCPCALVLSVPLAYFSGIGAASKLGILFKGGTSLEALGTVKAVVFDKTGTVTTGTFDVTEIYSYGELSERDILSICASAEQASTHPAAVSIVKYSEEHGVVYNDAENVRELSGRGISAEYKGKIVLCGNRLLMKENDIRLPDEEITTTGTVVYVAVNGVLVGAIIVSDTVKEKSASAVEQLKAMGLYTAMLTGDKTENARIVADETGIEYVKGELLPDGKLAEIRRIRDKKGSVMFIGDGINDGPVLAGADVGAAMLSGSDLAIEAADAIFMNKELDSAVKAKKIADRTLRISRQNIIFALAFKAAVLILGIAGFASMWFAVFADSGVAMLLILNSMRVLGTNKI